jgi:hypothetical protein
MKKNLALRSVIILVSILLLFLVILFILLYKLVNQLSPPYLMSTTIKEDITGKLYVTPLFQEILNFWTLVIPSISCWQE